MKGEADCRDCMFYDTWPSEQYCEFYKKDISHRNLKPCYYFEPWDYSEHLGGYPKVGGNKDGSCKDRG